jgi:hypothetical protein
MAVVSVDLDKLAHLVDLLATAKWRCRELAEDVRASMVKVYVDASVVGKWCEGGYALGYITSLHAQAQHCLDYARTANQVSPGVPRVVYDGYGHPHTDYVVSFDDTLMDADTAQQIASLVTQVLAGEIHFDGGVPPALLTWVNVGLADPQVAVQLAGLLPPNKLTQLLSLIDLERGNRERAGEDTTEFDQDYAQLIDGLGAMYSLAAQTMTEGSQEWADHLNSWKEVFTNAGAGEPYPQFASLIICRGHWPDEFLTGFTEAITSAEVVPGAWDPTWGPGGVPQDRVIVDPGRTDMEGNPIEVADPMYGVWSAAVWNPQWMTDTYGGGEPVVVTIIDDDGVEQRVSVPGDLYHVFHERGMDHASLLAFTQAASMTTLTDAPITGDVQTMMRALEKEYDDLQARPWWQKYGHRILQTTALLAGLAGVFIPGVGWGATALAATSLLASAVDIGMYVAEGDWDQALASGAFLLLPLGGGALLRVTMEQLAILKTGGIISVLGREYRLVDGALARLTPTIVDPAILQATNRIGYQTDRILDTGITDLWSKPPFQRGTLVDAAAGNNTGHNFPCFDHFDPMTGTATSYKSLDTIAQSYQTTSGLKSRLQGYVDDLLKFIDGRTGTGKYIDASMVEKSVLEVIIPNRLLTPAQIAALDAAKTYAVNKGVTITVTIAL